MFAQLHLDFPVSISTRISPIVSPFHKVELINHNMHKSTVHAEMRSDTLNVVAKKKLPYRCSKKCRRILMALDQVDDLNEAFKPWGDTLTVHQTSTILKEQSSWERALEIFQWFQSNDSCELDVVHYNIVIRILGKAGKWSHVLRLWDEMNYQEIAPDHYTYATLMDVYCTGGFHKEAFVWLQMMTKQGMEPTEVIVDTVHQLYKGLTGEDTCTSINGGGVVHEVEKRSESLGSVPKKLDSRCSTKCRTSFGGRIPAILKALDQIGDLDEALKPWEEKLGKKEGSIILKEQLCWERALGIFEWLKRKNCFELDVFHYNIVIKILGKAGKWSHVLRLWDEMNDQNIAPDNYIYATLIDVYCKGGFHKEALLWLQRMTKQGMKPDKVTYNVLIDMHGKVGRLKQASEIFALILREGIPPTTVIFNTMINIYGNHGQLSEVSSLVNQMEDVRCPPDTKTYNTLISIYAKYNYVNMAADYFTKMKEACLEPSPVTYGTLFHAYSVRHMDREAEDLILEMDERGLEIDENLFDSLKRTGDANELTFAMMLCIYKRMGRFREATQIAKQMRERRILTHLLSYNNVIGLYARYGRFETIVETLKEMMESAIQPDEDIFRILRCVTVECGVSEQVVAMLEVSVKKDAWSGLQKWISVLSCFV